MRRWRPTDGDGRAGPEDVRKYSRTRTSFKPLLQADPGKRFGRITDAFRQFFDQTTHRHQRPEDYTFRATGFGPRNSTGYLRVYSVAPRRTADREDDEKDDEGGGTGASPRLRKAKSPAWKEFVRTSTSTEASAAVSTMPPLVKELEEDGIGRPSTYWPRSFPRSWSVNTSPSNQGRFSPTNAWRTRQHPYW